MKIHISALVPAIMALSLATACTQQKKYLYLEGMVWNTSFHITYQSDKPLHDSIMLTLRQVEKSLSVFDTLSLTSRVNSRLKTVVNSDFITVYNASRKVWKESDGAFDPTASPLITAWGFGKGHKMGKNIDTDEILKYVGLGKTRLRNDTLVKSDIRTEFNFSAIAKGYGCDKVGNMLRRNGVESYLVEIGGEIALSGNSPRGDKWNVSIDRPIFSKKEIHSSQTIISLTDAGIATSGNYRNFHNNGKEKFGHTIDVKTGRPANTDILSATIIAPDCMHADAYATACMALGSARAKKMILHSGLAAMLITIDSTVWTSDKFKKYIK